MARKQTSSRTVSSKSQASMCRSSSGSYATTRAYACPDSNSRSGRHSRTMRPTNSTGGVAMMWTCERIIGTAHGAKGGGGDRSRGRLQVGGGGGRVSSAVSDVSEAPAALVSSSTRCSSSSASRVTGRSVESAAFAARAAVCSAFARSNTDISCSICFAFGTNMSRARIRTGSSAHLGSGGSKSSSSVNT